MIRSFRNVKTLTFILATSLPYTLAQSLIDDASVPECAQGCTLLQQAISACPTLPDGSEARGCFCQSAYLDQFYVSDDDVCDEACTAQKDRLALQQWYVGSCIAAEPAAAAAGAAAAGAVLDDDDSAVTEDGPSPPADDSTPTSDNSPEGSPAPIGSETQTGSGPRAGSADIFDEIPSGSWISNHWQWVLMLVLVFLAMVSSSILGVWIKRRYRLKRDLKRANVAAAEAVHGPKRASYATSLAASTNRLGTSHLHPISAADSRYQMSQMSTPSPFHSGSSRSTPPPPDYMRAKSPASTPLRSVETLGNFAHRGKSRADYMA